jgi:hypothetical protein
MTNPTSPMLEKMARIIDPDGWATRDRHYAGIDNLPPTRTDKDDLRRSADTYVNRSLMKAREIGESLKDLDEGTVEAMRLSRYTDEDIDPERAFTAAINHILKGEP